MKEYQDFVKLTKNELTNICNLFVDDKATSATLKMGMLLQYVNELDMKISPPVQPTVETCSQGACSSNG
jgi:hypothetical protein